MRCSRQRLVQPLRVLVGDEPVASFAVGLCPSFLLSLKRTAAVSAIEPSAGGGVPLLDRPAVHVVLFRHVVPFLKTVSGCHGVENQLTARGADSRLSPAELTGPQPEPCPVCLRQLFRVRGQVGHRVVEVENARPSPILSSLEQKPVNDSVCQPLGQEERFLNRPFLQCMEH